MIIRVRLFAMLRERAGASEIELDLPDGARVADALRALGDLASVMPVLTALNRSYVTPEVALSEGDELALIPPVSGGAGQHVRVTDLPLSLDRLVGLVSDRRAGAVVSFSGVTREVESLHYEAYAEMAEEQIAAITAASAVRHGLSATAVEHRTGRVALGEPSVIVVVSAPHREQAFAGAREIIDTLKAQAPIWKQEIEARGEARWVSGTLPEL